MYSKKLIETVRANAALLQQAADALYGAASSMKNVNQEENERTGLDGFWQAVLETQQKHYHTAMEVWCKSNIAKMFTPDDNIDNMQNEGVDFRTMPQAVDIEPLFNDLLNSFKVIEPVAKPCLDSYTATASISPTNLSYLPCS